jgi:hypothetical protein
VAEVADMGRAMDDLLPPLPPGPLAVGQRWSDSAGLELQRLPDSTTGRAVIRRLALHVQRAVDRATVRGDSIEIPARETTVEDGRVSWDETSGLLRRERRITVITEVPAGGLIRQPLRSRLEQEVVVERRTGSCPARTASP